VSAHGKGAKVSVSSEGGSFATMLWKDIYSQLTLQLQTIYPEAEAASIARLLVESWGKQPLRQLPDEAAPIDVVEQLPEYLHQLLLRKPVQYLLKEAWFYKYYFFVSPAVLIPRPETEELAEWIIQENKLNAEMKSISILDIGTGSGCIAITMKKELSKANVTAIDVSADALIIARENAQRLNTAIQFEQIDFLNEKEWSKLGIFDIIVSNPPYIAEQEKINIHSNVLDNEPHLALFVPDTDPLLFYKAIASFAQTHLSKNGSIYVEINQQLGEATRNVFEQNGFSNIQLKKDISGNERMIRASWE
jgi:release factor glutamine methyltransferase